MREYKIHKAPVEEQLTDQDINQHKDFGKLTANYDRITKPPTKPLYKDPKAFLGLVLILIIVYLLMMAEAEEQQQNNTNTNPTEQVQE